MKGDITHRTFQRPKHYDRVLQQQGRVTVDADFNEQADIFTYRLESTAADVIGPSGAPMGNAGFRVIDPASLTPAELAALQNAGLGPAANGDFLIGPGHYYVDGILVENERMVPFTKQPHLPDVQPLPNGNHLIYLDVWKRHVTALEDPSIREVALSGPDTATRSQVIWQVRRFTVPANVNCDTSVPGFDAATAPSSGKLQARSQPPGQSGSVCVLPPSAGYRRLENQLYRVEIHDASNPAQVSMKWSRENGSIAVRGEFINNLNDRLRLSQPGRDLVRGYANGDWIELATDVQELNFTPGVLVRLKSVDGNDTVLDLATATGPVSAANYPNGVKVRRWDSPGLVLLSSANPAVDDGYLRLEDGVQVKFSPGTFHNGDYWEIPARTATGDVIWPQIQSGPQLVPEALLPFGVRHHYARIAVVEVKNGNVTTPVQDCRNLFPPLTELTSLFYVSGDGQEAAPNPSAPAALLPLPQALQAGVANGSFPVAGAPVEFRVTRGNGRLNGGFTAVVVSTDNLGVAACNWSIDSATESQEVEARLINGNAQPSHLPVRYQATLSTAARVSYDPKNCSNLAGKYTVQDALDRLCQLGNGGCCVPVGEGHLSLEETLEKLLSEKRRLICLCLLAGEHVITRPLLVRPAVPGTAIHIHGCGGATLVTAKDHANLWAFEGSKEITLDEVHLEDFHLTFDAGTLGFKNVGAVSLSKLKVRPGAPAGVEISSCGEVSIGESSVDNQVPGAALRISSTDSLRVFRSSFSGFSQNHTPLVSLMGAREVHFDHNEIEPLLKSETEPHPSFNADAGRFETNFAALPGNRLEAFAAEIAKGLPTTAAARKKFVTSLRKSIDKMKSPQEKQAYTALVNLLEVRAVDAAMLIPLLSGLKAAGLVNAEATGLAVAGVSDGLELTANRVEGITVFYGPLPMLVNGDSLSAAAHDKGRFAQVAWMSRDAVVSGNRFGVVTVDRDFWKTVSNPGLPLPDSMFRQFAFTNNRLEGVPHAFVAGFLAFTGNYFQAAEGYIGGSLGYRAVFVSNQCQFGAEDIAFFLSAAVGNQPPAYLGNANQMLVSPI